MNDTIHFLILSFLVQPRKTEQQGIMGVWNAWGQRGVQKTHFESCQSAFSSTPHANSPEACETRKHCCVRWVESCLRDAGYNHLTVNHKEVFVDPQTGAHTQNIERFWGVCKATVWRFRGNRTESRLKDHLKVIEWTYWRGDIHKNGPLGMIFA